MWQDNFQFLFPQIFFGHLEKEEDWEDPESDENLDPTNACTLSFDVNSQNLPRPKIGLYIDWTDEI